MSSYFLRSSSSRTIKVGGEPGTALLNASPEANFQDLP